jgi:hemoglobin
MRYWSQLSIDDQDIYALIGEDGFHRLVHAFYRQVPADDLLGPMYPRADLAGAEERLRGFLIFRFGGPQRYIEERGHPRLRMRHAPFAIGQAARDRWMQLMSNALSEAALPAEVEIMLREFFEGTATFMINRLD